MGGKEFNSDHYGPVWRWAALGDRFSIVLGAVPFVEGPHLRIPSHPMRGSS
jgi:hypothetical protein